MSCPVNPLDDFWPYYLPNKPTAVARAHDAVPVSHARLRWKAEDRDVCCVLTTNDLPESTMNDINPAQNSCA